MGRATKGLGVARGISAIIAGSIVGLLSAPAVAQALEHGWKVREITGRETFDFGMIRLHIDHGLARKKYNSDITPADIAHLENRSRYPLCVAFYFAPPDQRYITNVYFRGNGAVYYVKPGKIQRIAAWVYSRSPRDQTFGFGETAVHSWQPAGKNSCPRDPQGAPRLERRFY